MSANMFGGIINALGKHNLKKHNIVKLRVITQLLVNSCEGYEPQSGP